MQLKLKPVLVVGSGMHVFPQPDGQLEVVTDIQTAEDRLNALHDQLRESAGSDVDLLEPLIVRGESDLLQLRQESCQADCIFINVTGGIWLGDLHHGHLQRLVWDLHMPVIAFSGECTPMMGLYILPVEERLRFPNVTFAMDFREVNERLRLLSVRKKLRHSKILLTGRLRRENYSWQHFPDSETTRNKLGTDLVPVSCMELLDLVKKVEEADAEALAQKWLGGALAGGEPSPTEVREAAKMYLGLERLVGQMGAQAVSVGCLELMYECGQAPFCIALAMLRDAGIPAGCEADATATLTMLVLDYLTGKSAYMGNVVRVDPENNRVMISHGCSPTRMAGRDKPPKPYRLVHSHSFPPFSRTLEGGAGVTSYVDYDRGQEVTITRLSGNLDRLPVTRGEIVDCRDTIADRTTITVQVENARRFFAKAAGNHQVVVYGDYRHELRSLCDVLGMAFDEA